MAGQKSEAVDEARSDITIGELNQRLSSLDTDRSELQRLPGVRRLTVAFHPFPPREPDELNWVLLDGLRQFLSGLPGKNTEWADGLRLSEAAQILEQPRGDGWARAIDQRPAACTKCGRRLADEDRALLLSWCDDCRSNADRIEGLDAVFRRSSGIDPDGRDWWAWKQLWETPIIYEPRRETGPLILRGPTASAGSCIRTEPPLYDKYCRSPLSCFEWWHTIKTYICELY
jgi:hypothetical protein